jgi:hypothetical protein
MRPSEETITHWRLRIGFRRSAGQLVVAAKGRKAAAGEVAEMPSSPRMPPLHLII